ncbi:MAG: hypothetical protein IKB66_03990 [Clostridia bacterium]|nr:hypothetical protein [Clostridia bacterium]
MDWKKLGKALLFPHIAIMIILIPIATVFLVYSMVYLGTNSIVAIISYVIAFYTLLIWCFKIPHLIKFFKNFKNQNKYAKKWQEDTNLRVNVSLYGTLFLNVAYALLNLGLGFTHKTFWFYSLAAYYIILALMRFFLASYTTKNAPGTNYMEELKKYRVCGIIFLILNLALSVIIFFMVYWNRTFNHHEITTIAMAAYTFTSFTLAIINMVKYRKNNSPVYLASKSINLASTCVSMLTLESTMLTTFGKNMSILTRQIFLASLGGAISIFVILMAIYMIIKGTKEIKLQNNAKEHFNGE